MSERSYASANVFPAKILCHQKLIQSCIKRRKVIPIHLQLNPTNWCPFDCSFCSCSNRNRKLELSEHDLEHILFAAQDVGCEAVTVTGGGEPLAYKHFKKMMALFDALEIQSGLVTNGLLLNNLPGNTGSMVWCRISSSNELAAQLAKKRKTLNHWFDTIEEACLKHSHIDWAFSHVVNGSPMNLQSLSYLRLLITFANVHDFTHVRIVNDILDPKMDRWKEMQTWLHAHTDTSRVIWQPRSTWTIGQFPCYISLLKPVVGADGYLYPCCGTQYAFANPSRDYEKTMRMGHARDLRKIIEEQAFFDGTVCVKCYYENYNWALGVLLSKLKHEKFV